MEVTSSTAQDKKAEIIVIKIRNLVAVRFFMRKIKLTSQAKNPASFNNPTKTIIPTRKRITSSEENFTTLSKSIVWVIKRTDVPIKANVNLKLQKNNVPRIEVENIEMESAWL